MPNIPTKAQWEEYDRKILRYYLSRQKAGSIDPVLDAMEEFGEPMEVIANCVNDFLKRKKHETTKRST